MKTANDGAEESLRKLEERYTCPSCRNKWLFDSVIGRCDACGYRVPSRWHRLRSYILRRFFGYARVSDVVNVRVNMSPVPFKPGKFNPDLVVPPKEKA
jgi:hypothetical protein